MATVRGSSAIVNRRVERGHPCCVPLERSKNDEMKSFVMTVDGCTLLLSTYLNQDQNQTLTGPKVKNPTQPCQRPF